MTTSKPTMALAELTEKGADVDLVREMIQPTRIAEMGLPGQ
jgi:hypothetical protein